MMMAEWPKLPVIHHSVGAFRHGFIETADASCGAVIFASPDRGAPSAWRLARTLEDYGAAVLVVEAGVLRGPRDEPTGQPDAETFLSPLLDVIPLQLAADRLAHRRGFGKGFRYIQKVVTQV
jgi:fructoselysine-6-P-deglycase FrlB-like protein